MTNGTMLIILGVLVALAPFSGLPHAWLDVLLPLVGVAVGTIGYVRRPRASAPAAREEAPVSAPIAA